jgi:hypothetical protein
LKARTQMIVKAGDVESGTSFVEAEHEDWSKFEDTALREFQARLQDDDLSQDQIDAVELFCDLVRERRTRFAAHITARKAKAAGLVRK